MMAETEAQMLMDAMTKLHLEDLVPFIVKSPSPKAFVREIIATPALRIASGRRRILLPSGLSLQATAI